jgi:guanylate kinase
MSQTAATNELGMILVISGPSGVGKDTVWKTAAPCLPTFSRAITCTTRERREGEVEGQTYYYVSKDEFQRMVDEDELIEWAEVHGNCYGVPQRSVFERINAGLDVVCVIDVQGAIRIRRIFPAATLVFIKPPEGRENEILAERIRMRSLVAQAELETRLNTASWEMTQTHLYDYEVVNDNLEQAAKELCEVISKERQLRNSIPEVV